MNETNRETERTAAEAAEETVNKPAARKKASGEAKKAPARKAAKPAADAAEKKAAPRGKKAVKAAEPSLAETICAFLSSKKAEDIVILDVREKTVLCDYFVVASGRNTTQVRALCAGAFWITATCSCTSSTTNPACSITSNGFGAKGTTCGGGRTEKVRQN